MNLHYAELEKEGRISRIRSSPDEIRQIISLADRDIKSAEFLITQNWDWAFSISYNAALQISRAYMFSKGFRAASHEAHKNTFEFMKYSLGKEHELLVSFFDRMRQKRNRVIYEAAGIISETEVKQLLKYSKEYIEIVKGKLVKYI